MTDVKIYTITSDDLSPPIKGEGFCTDMVRHSDYAALEARLNQLASENAGLKQSEVPLGAIENGRAFAERLQTYHFECQAGNLSMCSDWQELLRCFEHLAEWAMYGQVETPTTEAWQRELMAKGVEKFATAASDKASSCSLRVHAAYWTHAKESAQDFAAQLRKGGAA